MSNKRKIYLIVGLVIIVFIGFGLYGILYPKQRILAKETPEVNLSAKVFYKKMVKAGTISDFADKVVQTYGKITELDAHTLTLENKVTVHLTKPIEQVLSPGDHITLKGRYVGYDDLLDEVRIDQASIIQND